MWESSHRPEQMFTRDYLAGVHPSWKIRLEYRVTNLKIDGEPYKDATVDIIILKPYRIAVRLNGGYHFSSGLQETKDEFQKDALIQAGWWVFDLDHHMMPNLFNKKWDKETVKLAETELSRYFG
jgi:hypothetical protein